MNALRPLALTLAIAGALMVPAQNANAGQFINAGLGSGVCKHADGNNNTLQYSLQNVRNKSATIQYVICNVPFFHERVIGLLTGSGFQVAIDLRSSNPTAQTVTCTATVNHGNPGTVLTTKSGVVSTTLSARLNYDASELRAFYDTDSLSVYCGLPPGTAIAAFIAAQPDTNVLIP